MSTNPSDSIAYYAKIQRNFRGENWLDFYGTSTTFIEFVGYPFVKYLYFSYLDIMLVFAFLGFMGFGLMYIFFLEKIRFKNYLFGVNFIHLSLFLPNLHFWSSSFGKGSIIFFGIALYFFSLSKIKARLGYLLLSILIVYHVRPHIMLVMLLATGVSFIFSDKGTTTFLRYAVAIIAAGAFLFLFQDVMELTGLNDEDILLQTDSLSSRASSLGRATSGVDISNYNLGMKLFTFLFRPLFFDAPGALGVFVSVENLFYLLIIFTVIKNDFFQFLWRSDVFVKMAFISFMIASIFLAQISGNLGLAIRQKSQIMILFMFVILSYMDDKKEKVWIKNELRMKRIRAHRQQPDVEPGQNSVN